ncbi:phasin family protein [Spirulina subsalsa FACHB-351]|uniref:Phasin family protein n=1 Tax=Spirulina subsalsa FACHB-351 TaxID=234711 RepID=A0ABT3L9Y9_9CYAN|nr:phasin family protein [Spirulina subsalsa]MCW6038333.1 phasin family protein [Spirulina subsalsa FACHB-351]
MPDFGNLVQKAFYLGVGIASYAGEKANLSLQELRSQAQKLAEEMVKRGEITTEEASKLVDEWIQQAQHPSVQEGNQDAKEPRRIEIILDEDPPASNSQPPSDPVQNLRDQVQNLQEELRRIQKDS